VKPVDDRDEVVLKRNGMTGTIPILHNAVEVQSYNSLGPGFDPTSTKSIAENIRLNFIFKPTARA